MQLALYLDLLRETKAKLAEGKCPDCFFKKMLKDQEKNEINDEWLSYIGGSFVSLGNRSILASKSDSILDGSWFRHYIIDRSGFYPSHDQASCYFEESPRAAR